MRLDNKRVLEKIREYFQNPFGFADLPHYIVASWRIIQDYQSEFKSADELLAAAEETHGAIFNTQKIEDVRDLYILLTSKEVKELRLYQITPERVVFLLEYLGVNV